MLILSFALLFINYEFLENINYHGFQVDLDRYSGLGDFIGGITAPIAIILLYMTYSSQKNELEETRKIMNAQASTMKKQQFESTFFHMLDNFNNLRNSFKPQGGVNKFNLLYNKMASKIDPNEFNTIHKNNDPFVKAFRDLMMEYDTMEEYFSILSQTCEIIEKGELSRDQKVFYFKILRANLGQKELLLIYYNSFTTQGKKLAYYIHEFNLLMNIKHYKKLEFKKYAIDFEANETLLSLMNLLLRSLYGLIKLNNKTNLKYESISIISNVHKSIYKIEVTIKENLNKWSTLHEIFKSPNHEKALDELQNFIEEIILDLIVYNQLLFEYKPEEIKIETTVKEDSEEGLVIAKTSFNHITQNPLSIKN